ncbi:hypothetical protein GCM10025865_09020 [Paraoerskovia sediminicola]|uniref:MobA-like NTP transferase domain-containing protein n=1 Tax=Paraoerskovia sediminicola TaxID=1138587 RepID=A0ABN6XDQ7_9CELL|nr:NTP transferase domain-containing protein [Paraoerskovia sediminicola]BDZ41603.1 hypothetical protein GCM10025865_09020 [Paraoerskovia sediminicola]
MAERLDAPTTPGETGTTVRAAVILAAGHDDVSRGLLTHSLGDATVVELAVANVRSVVPAERIVVVVAPGDREIRRVLGDDVTYVTQLTPRGTGDAVLAARTAVGHVLGADADDATVLVAYADTPLLRTESLLGLLTRHTLTDADLTLLSAVVDDPEPGYGRIERSDHEITAILESEDRTAAEGTLTEINVGAYVAAPALLFRELEAIAEAGSTASPSWPAASSRTGAASRRTGSTTPTRSVASTPTPSSPRLRTSS